MDTKEVKIVGEKQDVLEAIIPEIKKFDNKRGCEGVAFFVGKEFVVKYFERINLKYSLFNSYCEEISSYAQMGFSYPKIYSWAVTPICAKDNVFRYYILQEQIKGDILYPYSLSDIKPRCETFCSKQEFERAVEDVANHGALYMRILEEMASLYLDQNGRLKQVFSEEVSKFIWSYFEMNKKATYSDPDLHPGNVLFDGTKLTMIDGSMCEKNGLKWLNHLNEFNPQRHYVFSFYDILDLFSCNRHIYTYIQNYKKATGDNRKSKAEKLVEENEKVLGSVLELWVKEARNFSNGLKLSSFDIDYLYGAVHGMISSKSDKRILKALENDGF